MLSHCTAARRSVQALVLALACSATTALCAAPADAAATAVASAPAAQGTLSGWNTTVISDASATNGTAVRYGNNGAASVQLTLPADADTLTLGLRGDQCSGAPAYTVTVDGTPVASGVMSSTSWTNVSDTTRLDAGTHTVSVAFTNYTFNVYPACARRLYLEGVTASASAGMTAPATNSAIPAGFVHQSGTQLLDGANQPLRLRGVNLGGWLSWEGWLWGQGTDYIGETAMMNNLTSLVGATPASQFQTNVYNNYVTGADFHQMSEDGLNVARVPFNYRMLEDDANPFVYKQSGWNVLDQAVAEAKANNVYLVLDMHVTPCSQTYSFTADYAGGPFLWSNAQCQARTVALWKAIAARYASANVIAGYDLINEPMIGNSQLLGLYQQITAAIRSVDTNHMIIYEGNNLARDFSMFTKPLDSNEMLEVHDYSWSFGSQPLSARMPSYDAAAKAINAPIWAGEFGQDVVGGISNYVKTFNQDPLFAGWADWTWKQAPGLAAMQTIQETPASKLLLAWMDNTSRPKPTVAQATQGMSDFITSMQFANTLPNPQMEQALSGS